MVFFSILFDSADSFGEDFSSIAPLKEVVVPKPYRGCPIYLRSESHRSRSEPTECPQRGAAVAEMLQKCMRCALLIFGVWAVL